MEENIRHKVRYIIYAKNPDDAIDIKNKILINTTDKELVDMEVYVNKAYEIL